MGRGAARVRARAPTLPAVFMSVLGIVLCAGFGSRLAPLTDQVPKPLVPVANRPVLDLVLDRMAEAGVTAVGINLHHRAESLRTHLRQRLDLGRQPVLRLHYEPQILD